MDPEQMRNGHQLILIGGSLRYKDGFENTPTAKWSFCIQSIFATDMKILTLVPCDPNEYLPKLEQVDGYPKNEQR
jgi:hypothetical protein